jgi:hypothetical protein
VGVFYTLRSCAARLFGPKWQKDREFIGVFAWQRPCPFEGMTQRRKNPHAMALGKLGGLKGGRARAEKLSARRRRQIARQAAIARWSAD